MDRYFYSVEMDGDRKVVHLSGNVYFNDADETETCYRIAEWTFLCFNVNEAQLMFDTDTFYEFINERVNYLTNISKQEANEMCKSYFNGRSGTELHISDLTANTPCGDYWFE